MKSLNTKIANGCPFDREFFTDDILSHIISEGFKIERNDSYAERRNLESDLCYKKYEPNGAFDIFIFICEDGIEIDFDYECGGNSRTHFINFSDSFEEAYDEMVDYINNNR